MTETTTREYRIATNEAVMRALGISQLAHLAERVDLVMLPNELPMLTIRAYVEETPTEHHIPSQESFNLDKACSEAMDRLSREIDRSIDSARQSVNSGFEKAREAMIIRHSEESRWFWKSMRGDELMRFVGELLGLKSEPAA